MNAEKLKDVKDTALKLEVIHTQSPTDYFYLKGWIHCLLQKEKHTQQSLRTTRKSNHLDDIKL